MSNVVDKKITDNSYLDGQNDLAFDILCIAKDKSKESDNKIQEIIDICLTVHKDWQNNVKGMVVYE